MKFKLTLSLVFLVIAVLLISGGCAETPENKSSDTPISDTSTSDTPVIADDVKETKVVDDTFFEVHLNDNSETTLNIFGKDYDIKTSIFKKEVEIEILAGSTKRSLRFLEGQMYDIQVFNFSANVTNIIPDLGVDVIFLKI